MLKNFPIKSLCTVHRKTKMATSIKAKFVKSQNRNFLITFSHCFILTLVNLQYTWSVGLSVMIKTLIYIPNDKHNYPFRRTELLKSLDTTNLKPTNQNSIKGGG